MTKATSQAIEDLVVSATKKWARQKKAEERSQSASTRRAYMWRSSRVTLKDAAWEVIPEAYMKASTNDTLPTLARQIMYASRKKIEEKTGEHLDDQYFTQTLLPDYMAAHPETADWYVVYDERGHLYEPHDDTPIALGTLAVRNHLQKMGPPSVASPEIETAKLKRHGPEAHYGAILFIEKEGFQPLFEKVKLAERYDIAIASTKGMSNTAFRELIDSMCPRYEMTVFVLHDFDKSGFSIVGTLRRDTRRYEFANKVKVIDLGIRLEDIEEYSLDYEHYSPGKSEWKVRENLRENGATEEEIEVLLNQRVELNAFTSGQLIEWIESKLKKHGVEKVIPDDGLLEKMYRQACASAYLQHHADGLIDKSNLVAEKVDVPDNLRRRVSDGLKETPTQSWDEAVSTIANSDFDPEEIDSDEGR